jgi:hypothetical protein
MSVRVASASDEEKGMGASSGPYQAVGSLASASAAATLAPAPKKSVRKGRTALLLRLLLLRPSCSQWP